ncbi:MAG: hypothetical protein ACP5HZ_08805 [Ferrimicrobium sp.]
MAIAIILGWSLAALLHRTPVPSEHDGEVLFTLTDLRTASVGCEMFATRAGANRSCPSDLHWNIRRAPDQKWIVSIRVSDSASVLVMAPLQVTQGRGLDTDCIGQSRSQERADLWPSPGQTTFVAQAFWVIIH